MSGRVSSSAGHCSAASLSFKPEHQEGILDRGIQLTDSSDQSLGRGARRAPGCETAGRYLLPIDSADRFCPNSNSLRGWRRIGRAMCTCDPRCLQLAPHNDVSGINALELVLGLRMRSAIPAHMRIAAGQRWALSTRRKGGAGIDYGRPFRRGWLQGGMNGYR